MKRKILTASIPLAVMAIVGTTFAASAASAGVPANPAWQSSDPEGTWQHDNFLFQNDMWSGACQPTPHAACGPQSIWANSPNDWGVTANMAKGNTEVLTYPDIGRLFGTDAGQAADPVSGYQTISNSFAETMPNVAGEHAEAADDVWLNHWNIEIMIWTEDHGQDASYLPVIGHPAYDGVSYTVYQNGSGNGAEYIFKMDKNESSGTTHILWAIDWLIKHGKVPANSTLTEVEYGWEIASTGGTPQDFHMSHYQLYAH